MKRLGDFLAPPTWASCVKFEAIKEEYLKLVSDYRRDLLKNLQEKVSDGRILEDILDNRNWGQSIASGLSPEEVLRDSLNKSIQTQCGTTFVEKRMEIVSRKNPHFSGFNILPNDRKQVDAEVNDAWRKFHLAMKSQVNHGSGQQHTAIRMAFQKIGLSKKTKPGLLDYVYILLLDESVRKPTMALVGDTKKKQVNMITLGGQAGYYFLSGGNPHILTEMNSFLLSLGEDFYHRRDKIISEGLHKHGYSPRMTTIEKGGGMSWGDIHGGQRMNLEASWAHEQSKEILVSLMGPWYTEGCAIEIRDPDVFDLIEET